MSKALMTIQDFNGDGDSIRGVDARELYRELGLRKQFTDWVRQWAESGEWVENVDWGVFHQEVKNSSNGRPTKEYVFSIKMAEHIAMMTHTAKGSIVREYFRDARDERNELVEAHEHPMVAQARANLQLTQRFVQVEQELAEAREDRARIDAKTDMLIDEQRMTLEAFVLKNGLLRQCPRSTWKAGGKWCSEFCTLYNIPARAVTVHGKAWQIEQAYPPEALMAWVDKLAREGGQGDLGTPVRRIK